MGVAYCYANGKGVEEDLSLAALYWFKAAEKGDAPSQFNLAMCFLYGIGFEKNIERAKEWMQKSADQGYEKAIQYLETMEE